MKLHIMVLLLVVMASQNVLALQAFDQPDTARFKFFNEFDMIGEYRNCKKACLKKCHKEFSVCVLDKTSSLTYYYEKVNGYWKNIIKCQFVDKSLVNYPHDSLTISKRYTRYIFSDSIYELIQTYLHGQLFSVCASAKTKNNILCVSNIQNPIGIDTLLFLQRIITQIPEQSIDSCYWFIDNHIIYKHNPRNNACRLPLSKKTFGVWPGIEVLCNFTNDIQSNDGTYITADIMPNYPLGEQGLILDLKLNEYLGGYASIENKVYLKFLISSSGKILDVKAYRCENQDNLKDTIMREAESILTFSTGNVMGNPINAWYLLALKFDKINHRWIPCHQD